MPHPRVLAHRLLDRIRPRLHDPVVFLHIPKCGGTSVSNAIRRSYPAFLSGSDRHLVDVHHHASRRAAEAAGLSVPELRDLVLLYYLSDHRVRFVTGHVRVWEDLLARFEDRFAFVTLLRHPARRWISHYFFGRYRPYRGHNAIEEDLPAFLDTERARRLGNVYVRKLAGTDDVSDASIARACANLDRFACAGTLDHLPAFLDAFHARFGISLDVRLDNPNPAGPDVRRERITPEVLDRIEALCRPDYAVYRHLLRRLGVPEPEPVDPQTA